MKKRHAFPWLAVVIVLLAVGTVYAQTTRVVANVPFDFVIDSKALPAGEYNIVPASDLGALAIRGDGGYKTFALSRRVEAGKTAENTKLVFHRYGEKYFLSQVWIQGMDAGRELPKSRLEKEEMIRAANHIPETVIVVAVLK